MSADRVLEVELQRLDSLIERELRRMRARYELSVDEFHGLYITDRRVDELVRTASPADASGTPVPDVAEARAADTASRWTQLARALDLTGTERDVLLMCVAPELDAKYETLYAYLNDEVTWRWPTMELVERVLAPAADRGSAREALLPGSRLVASGTIAVMKTQRDVVRARRPLRAAAPLRDWLTGLPYADDRLVGLVRFGGAEPLIPPGAIPAAVRPTLAGLARALEAGTPLPVMFLTAPTCGEADVFAEDLFARARRAAIIADLSALRTTPDPADAIAALELAQRILGVGLIVSSVDAVGEGEGRTVDPLLPPLRRLASRSDALALTAAAGVRRADLFAGLHTVDVDVPEMSVAERTLTWRHVLAPHGTRHPHVSALAPVLADRFVFGADRIVRTVSAASAETRLLGTAGLTEAGLFAAARSVSVADAGGTTRPLSTALEWEDLVLPPDVKQRLEEVVLAIALRGRVLDEWGFARRTGGARGVRILLSGPSGTGKSTAAAIVGRRLQLDVHRIELGTVVSKYIGETEKNLDRAFSAARRGNAILFIDEADALLGKRSQVKDAHDRYANVETAFLLQKMEDHDGIVIVATNLAQNIDPAFSRRMQYAIEFPLPDAIGRERLWRGMIGNAPTAGSLDFGFLARQFDLSGGDIRNVVLDAAFAAVHDGGAIALPHVLRAIARQYIKGGRVPTPGDFLEHYSVLVERPEPVTQPPR